MRFWSLLPAVLAAFVLPQQASAAWTEARSKHFIIYSEQKPAALQRFAEQLERFDSAVRIWRGMSDPALSDGGRITIYVLRDQGQVAAIAGAGSSGVAGLYIPRASGALAFVHRQQASEAWQMDGQTVFFHEYLHHLMLSESNLALPGWIVEGSAELFATAKFQKDGSIVFGHAPQHRGYGLREFNSLPLATMIGATPARLTEEQREQIYGSGWLLAHYLTFGAPARKGQIERYVAAIQKGRTPAESATAAFGDLRELDRELQRYLRRSSISGIVIKAGAITSSAVTLRPLTAGENAILPIRMRSEKGVNRRQAERLVGDARRVAASFPADPEVLASLAEAERDAGNDAAAVAAADRALAASPNHHRAMVMKARALLTSAQNDRAKADWNGLRALISRANRLDPDDPEPLMLFHSTYAAQGIAPTRNAVEGLLYAQALVPQDEELRMMAVAQLISDKKLAAARSMLGPLAYSPHAGKAREMMLKLMDALTANDAKLAVSLLQALSKQAEEDARS